jgi:hypothetical protein
MKILVERETVDRIDSLLNLHLNGRGGRSKVIDAKLMLSDVIREGTKINEKTIKDDKES